MIDILMATYNGEKFIKDLLNSLDSQTKHFDELLISDDCSKDLTTNLIEEYSFKFDVAKKFLYSERSLGSRANFSKLLEHSQSDYSFLCDQDDVWLENKVEISLQKMYEMEAKYGQETPILIHTDLQVVNYHLKLISRSFRKYQNLNPYPKNLIPRLLVQNFVTGCTILMNKALKNIVVPIPEEAIIHDWWIALVSAALGKVSYIDYPCILYRQHTNNSIGAREWSFQYILSRVLNINYILEDIHKTINQAKKFRDIYYKSLTLDQLNLIEEYIFLQMKPFLYRKYKMMRNGYYQVGNLKNLGFFFLI